MSVREYIELYTDGSCLKSGIGGWGIILKQPAIGYEKEFSGSTFPTTNNRMELTAVIEGLKILLEPCAVAVTTDSMYVCNGIMQGWAEKWKRQNWQHGLNHPVKNADLWQVILELQLVHLVKVQWVRGHKGHVENERCDQLATYASSKLRKEMFPKVEEEDASVQVPRGSSGRRHRKLNAQVG